MQDPTPAVTNAAELHAATVPVLAHYLRRLDHLLGSVAAHERRDELLGRRLAPDMFNLAQQARIATGFALRIVAPLTGRAGPEMEADDGIAMLRANAARALAHVDALCPADFAAAPAAVETIAGEARLTFAPLDFVRLYALPNFFFHLAMLYALLRAAGLAVGKPDFDGWHSYPDGFSFV